MSPTTMPNINELNLSQTIDTKYRSSIDYSRMSDSNIIIYAQAGDIKAIEYLLYKYKGLVRVKSKRYFLIGSENEDLLQVGMIGLWQSIADYSIHRNISFVSFASMCIERHIISAIKVATRLKQSPLNKYIPLDNYNNDSDDDTCLSKLLISDDKYEPEQIIIKKENKSQMFKRLKKILSKHEWNVLELYSYGESYQSIAKQLNCKTKSVDNALGRIKRKMNLHFNQECF